MPEAPNCLMSLSQIDDGGGSVDFKDGLCWIRNGDKIIGKGYKSQRLYSLHARAILTEGERANYTSTEKLSWDQWHWRYGHISRSALQMLEREKLVNGLNIDQSSIPSSACKACIKAKQTHCPFPAEAENRSEIPGERFMSDVWGPARVTSIGGWKYYISFSDDNIQYFMILFLQNKSDAASRIKEYVAKVKQKFGKAPTYMRIDNGKELLNDEIITFCRNEGITIETTAPYSPSQNGVAEHFNRTLIELVQAMIIARNLPIFLWDEAAAYATFISNRSPTRALKGKTPYKAWIGKKPDVSFLREFGSEVWVLDESRNRSKLEAKVKKVIFVGIMEGSKAIRYWDKDSRAIRVLMNFTFSRSRELRELQVTEVPGLGAEGEDISNTTPQTTSDNVGTTPEPPNQITPITSTPTLCARSTLIDYSKLNNPQSWKPTTWKPITLKESKIDDRSE